MAGTTVLVSILGNMTIVVIRLCRRITFLTVAVASHVLSVIAMAILCSWCRSGLVHLLVGIVTVRLLVIATLVAYISLGASLVEVALVRIVAVDVECPATVLPCIRCWLKRNFLMSLL